MQKKSYKALALLCESDEPVHVQFVASHREEIQVGALSATTVCLN